MRRAGRRVAVLGVTRAEPDQQARGVSADLGDDVARIGQVLVDVAGRDLDELITGEREPELTPMALGPLVAAEVEKVRMSTWAVADEISIDGVDELEDIQILGGEMLSSVFGNLLSNAVLHNDTPQPEVTVDATVSDEVVQVRIADNGPGIDDDRKEAVFGRGEKGVESPGSGLGLYLVAEIVSLYGGDVWVEDNDPHGTVVVVEFQRA